jgi:hypothetical protein
MVTFSATLHRTYRVGTKPVIPPELYEDFSVAEQQSARYTLAGLINTIFGQYLENQSRIVRSICEQNGPMLPSQDIDPTKHYGNLRKVTHSSANIADSAHAYLHWSYAQFLTQVSKFVDFLTFLQHTPDESVVFTWLASGFIPRWCAQRLAAQWQIHDWHWVRNLIRGWRNTLESRPLWPALLGTRKTFHTFPTSDWSQAGLAFLKRLDHIMDQRMQQRLPITRLQSIWRILLQILSQGLDQLAECKINGLSASQKQCAQVLQETCGGRNYWGALGLLYAELMMIKFGKDHISPLLCQLVSQAKTLLSPPFSTQNHSARLPVIILTSPKYILLRPNGQTMTNQLRVGASVSLTLPRKPKSASQLLSTYSAILTPFQQIRLRDEFPQLPTFPPGLTNIHTRHFQQYLLGLRLKRWLRMKLTPTEATWIQQWDSTWHLTGKKHFLQLQLHVQPSVLKRIQNGAIIEQILVHPPHNASKHTIIVLQFAGQTNQLVCAPHASSPQCSPASIHVLGYDLNRLSIQAVTFGALDSHNQIIHLEPISSDLLKKVARINHTLQQCDTHVAQLQQQLARVRGIPLRARKYATELRLIHQKRENLKQEAELCIAQVIYHYIQVYKPSIVAYEDLRGLSTDGKRGRLAKIVNYMCKRSDALADRLQQWDAMSPHYSHLQKVDPRYTSQIHFSCGGRIVRNLSSWDHATCTQCGLRVNTQLNAPLRIAEKGAPILTDP